MDVERLQDRTNLDCSPHGVLRNRVYDSRSVFLQQLFLFIDKIRTQPCTYHSAARVRVHRMGSDNLQSRDFGGL